MRSIFLLILCFLTGVSTLFSQKVAEADSLYVSNIVVMGNRTTRSWVIERELSLKKGDSLSKAELIRQIGISKNNLRNTSLFNSNDINYVIGESGNIELFILVNERWYIWPQLIFELAETNFNSWWENKDFSRINYGVSVNHRNFRGRNEELALHAQFGFTELLSISYFTPYLNKDRTLGLGLTASYGQNHEINYNSEENKRLFYKDVDEVQQRHVKTGFALRYRRRINHKHLFRAEYNGVDISDSVKALNPDYLLGDRTEEKFFSLTYQYMLDQRNNTAYATEGNYLSAELTKFGLGLFDSDVDLWWSKLEAKKFVKLSQKFYLAGMLRSHFYLNGKQPYFLRDGLGYTDKSTIRAYELYVIDAQQSAIGKFQVRYRLHSKEAMDMNFVPLSQFRKFYYSIYLGAFSDAGYGWDVGRHPMNNLANDLQYGSGLSLDITTIYDLVFRAEYSVNKFGEHRLFLHFVAPI